MDEQFHNSRILSREKISAFSLRRNNPSLLRFLIQFGLFLTSGIVFVAGIELNFASSVLFTSFFTFAVFSMSMFALSHELSHNTAFASRQFNRFVAWIIGPPIFYTPLGFREMHFAHHRYTNDLLKDPEIAIAGKQVPSVASALHVHLFYLTGLPLMIFKILLIIGAALNHKFFWDGLLFYVTPGSRAKLTKESRIVLLFYFCYFLIGFLWLPGILYLLLANLLGHAMLSWVLFAEHNGLAHEGDILQRTRTTLTNPILRWIMWNMPYHAEHHAYPSVPWYNLPKLHQELKSELKYEQNGYLSISLKTLKSLLRGKAFREV